MRGFKNGVTDEQVLALRHGYYAATSYLVAQVGRVLDEVEALGLRENTIVVFWSDHGFHLGEHDLWCKTSNFELDARVPLIISVPHQKTAGQRSDALVELLDVYPTLADLCGLPAPSNLEGKSLKPVLEDSSVEVKSAAFTQHPRPAYPPGRSNPDVMGYSMRTGRFRYTEWRKYQGGRIVAKELYDHQQDPQENENLAGDPTMTETLRQLAADLSETIAP